MKILCSILIWLTFTTPGCTDFEGLPFQGKLDLPDKYSYEVRQMCFCGPPYLDRHRITIEGGSIVDYKNLTGDIDIQRDRLDQWTIDALVDRVNKILSGSPFRKEIRFHPIYGFPDSVYFDISETVADEEWGYEITNFEPL